MTVPTTNDNCQAEEEKNARPNMLTASLSRQSWKPMIIARPFLATADNCLAPRLILDTTDNCQANHCNYG
jgi:hypothetical protein